MRRWFTRAGWLLVAGLAAAIGVSYVRPWSVSIERGETDFLHFRLSRGNVCAVWATLYPIASSLGERPIEPLVKRWEAASATAWDRFNASGVIGVPGTPFAESGLSCTLFLPLALVLIGKAAIWTRRRYRGRWWPAFEEALRPTALAGGWKIVRWLRRAGLAGSCVLAFVSVCVWMASYRGLPGNGPDFFLLGPPDAVRWATRGGSASADIGWPFPFALVSVEGNFDVTYRECVSPARVLANAVPVWRFGGFASLLCADPMCEWSRPPGDDEVHAYPYHLTTTSCSVGPAGTRGAYFYRATRIPCWALVAATSAWPVVAFIRGPWRQAGRRMRGLCAACGYDLQGSVSAVCPECGTAVPRGAERRSAGEGASALRAEKTVIEIGASTRD